MGKEQKLVVKPHLDRIEITLHVEGMTNWAIMKYLSNLGYTHTTAEKENLALFTCDDILKHNGKMYYHRDYQIRTLANTLKLYLHEAVTLPVIEFEDESVGTS